MKKGIIIQRVNALSTTIPQGPGASVFTKIEEELARCQAALEPTLFRRLVLIVAICQIYSFNSRSRQNVTSPAL